MAQTSRHRCPRARHPAAVLLLALALLLAQGLGLAHRVLHGPTEAMAQVSCDEHGDHGDHGGHGHHHHGHDHAHDHAFGHEAGSVECRLVDSLGCDLAGLAAAALATDTPGDSATPSTPARVLPAVRAAAYQARGPPPERPLPAA